MTTVCEVGPGAVRLLEAGIDCAAACPTPPAEMAVDGWRSALEPLLAGAVDVLLVHPSWWTADRVALVAGVAGDIAARVRTIARGELLHPNEVFVEIGPEFVVIGDRQGIAGAETRCAEMVVVADRVAGRLADGLVHIDAPAGVPGADALAAQLARRLRVNGRRVRVLTDRHLRLAARDAPQPVAPKRRIPPIAVRVPAAVAALALVAGMAIAHEKTSATTNLVEGRVTMRVPADWTVRRVTDGPGSARVEVAAPDDPGAVLYLTQSALREPDPAATAAALRAALDAEPPGVFVDFTPADQRSGRPAVTYREIRPGREIAWTVLSSGRVRIAIGCQRAPAACAEAIASAREIG